MADGDNADLLALAGGLSGQPGDMGNLPAGMSPTAPPLGTAPLPTPPPAKRMAMPGAGLPNIIQLLAGVLKPQKPSGDNYQGLPGQVAPRPNSRLDVFENFLGQFLTSFSAGMAQSGQRGAEGKGFAAAVNAPYQRSLQQQEFGLQQRGVESQEGLRAAQEEFNRQRATQFELVPMTVMGPDGNPQQVMVPQNSVGRIQAAIQGQQGKIISAQDHDQTLKDIAALKNPTVKITPDIAQNLGLSSDMVGMSLSAKDIHLLSPGTKTVSTTEGIYMVNGANGKMVVRLGGNPAIAAANIGANTKITVQQMRNDSTAQTRVFNAAGRPAQIMYSKAMDGINQWAREEEKTGYLSFGADMNAARQAFEQERNRRVDKANADLLSRMPKEVQGAISGTGPAGVPIGTAATPNRIPKANQNVPPNSRPFASVIQADPQLQQATGILDKMKPAERKAAIDAQVAKKQMPPSHQAILYGYYGIK